MLIRFRDGSGFPSPFSLFDDLFTRDLSSFFGRDIDEMLQRNQGVAMPAVNIRETDKDFQIELAAPGLRKEDFRVNVEHNTLTISAQQETEREENQPTAQKQGANATDQPVRESSARETSEGNVATNQGTTGQMSKQGESAPTRPSQSAGLPHRYTRREFSYSSFQRSFSLPESVDPEKISANYQNGILTVTVPKREAQQTRLSRNIDIS